MQNGSISGFLLSNNLENREVLGLNMPFIGNFIFDV